MKIPGWALYLLLAVFWLIAVEAVVAFEVLLIALSRDGGLVPEPWATPVFTVTGAVLAGLLAWWLARALAGAGAPSRLWVVPAIWAVVAALPSLFGFGIAGQRSVYGLVGVLGTFVLSAIGFWLGMWSVREAR